MARAKKQRARLGRRLAIVRNLLKGGLTDEMRARYQKEEHDLVSQQRNIYTVRQEAGKLEQKRKAAVARKIKKIHKISGFSKPKAKVSGGLPSLGEKR